MNKTISKIVITLVVSLTATICVLIPEVIGNSSTPTILVVGYVFLLGLSMCARKNSIAKLLVICALALPASEFIWCAGGNYWDWDTINSVIDARLLTFSFLGLMGYVVVCLIAPAAVLIIGNFIRQHRQQSA